MAIDLLSQNSFLEAYLELNKTLAKTLVIKSDTSADVLNDRIDLLYGVGSVDRDDKTSWKYYKNICGIYHTLNAQMTVTSLDTLAEIAFTKENLSLHVATKEAYKYGSRYYYTLLRKYPENEQLINGILTPADMTTAINAVNGTILAYPEGLVEPQETSLIQNLEWHIKVQFDRWNVTSFGLSDSLYNAAQHALMYLSLVPKILNLRLAKCKTAEAHSFHIREYLASHKRLDRYLPYMTLKQALYFYRNINYIERNAGKAEQFDELVGKLLTDRMIPISDYSVRHMDSFDETYRPDIRARRKPINTQVNTAGIDYIDIDVLYSKEAKLVYGNPSYYAGSADSDTLKFKQASATIVQTKDIESSMVDYTNNVPDTLEMVLMREWISLATSGLYNVVVNFKDPKTSEIVSLYAKDAFIYFLYIASRAVDINAIDILPYFNMKYRKLVKPTISELMRVVDSKHKDLAVIGNDILAKQPVIGSLYSTKAFFTLANKVYEESVRHWKLVSNTHELDRRAYLESMALQLYEDKFVEFDGMYSEWLSANNLPEYSYTQEEALAAMTNIYVSATGISVDDTKSAMSIQKAMIGLMTELSSYSIQFITEINDGDIRPINWSASRLGNSKVDIDADSFVESSVSVVDKLGSISSIYEVGSVISTVKSMADNVYSSEAHIPIAVGVVHLIEESRDVMVYFKPPTMSFTITGDLASSGYFDALTDEQKLDLFLSN